MYPRPRQQNKPGFLKLLIFGIVLVVVGVLVLKNITKPVRASTAFQIASSSLPDNSNNISSCGASFPTGCAVPYTKAIQTFIAPETFTASAIQFYGAKAIPNATSSTYRAEIWTFTGDYGNPVLSLIATTSEYLVNDLPTFPTKATTTLYFTTTAQLNYNGWYLVQWVASGQSTSTSEYLIIYNHTNDIYAGTAYKSIIYSAPTGVWSDFGSDIDIFLTGDTVDYVTPIYPASGQTIATGSPTIFSGTYNNLDLAYDQLIVEVTNSANSVTTFYEFTLSTSTASSSYALSQMQDGGSYFYRAYLQASSTGARTSEAEFITYYVGEHIVGFTPGDPDVIDSMAEMSVCLGIDTSSVFGAINCALRRAVFWAFHPRQRTTDLLYQTALEATSTFPYSVALQITALAESVASSTQATSTASSTLRMPVYWNMADTGADWFNANMIKDNLPYFQTIYNSVKWLVYLATFWIILSYFFKQSPDDN